MWESKGDFSTKTEPVFITIDGEKYNLKTISSTVGSLNLRDLSEEYQKLLDLHGKKRTLVHNERIVAILQEMMNLTLDAPVEVIQKLDDIQRGQIMSVVTKEIQNRPDPTKSGTESPLALIDSTESETG